MGSGPELAYRTIPQARLLGNGRSHRFVDIDAMALSAAIKGSIFAVPEACFVMMMALPFGSTRALLTAQDIRL
jgi:hypothetical protein